MCACRIVVSFGLLSRRIHSGTGNNRNFPERRSGCYRDRNECVALAIDITSIVRFIPLIWVLPLFFGLPGVEITPAIADVCSALLAVPLTRKVLLEMNSEGLVKNK